MHEHVPNIRLVWASCAQESTRQSAITISDAEKLRAGANALSSHIIREAGFRGHERKQSSHSERARLAVTKSIHRGIEKIRQLNPALGRHLANSIRTGYFCSYAPRQASPVTWRF